MSTEINEPIQAGIVFDRGRVQPSWFIWNGRKHVVREVTQRWQTREGREDILHLGVTDGAQCFELAFNQHTLAWRLVSLETEGCA
jgi:hypothetical protein